MKPKCRPKYMRNIEIKINFQAANINNDAFLHMENFAWKLDIG